MDTYRSHTEDSDGSYSDDFEGTCAHAELPLSGTTHAGTPKTVAGVRQNHVNTGIAALAGMMRR